MGLPMAANIAEAGHRVRGYARRDEAREAGRARGIEPVDSVSAAVTGADIVITMLTDGDAVREVAAGDDGVIAHIGADAIYVDMSTIAPGEWAGIEREFAAIGVDAIDAPVSGGQAGAIEGVLAIMAGGAQEAISRANEVLRHTGTVTRVGDSGAGQSVKAANQLIVAGTIQLVAEALVLLEKGEVDLATALDVIGRGLAGSTVIARKRDALLERRYEPGFRLALHAKDMAIVADTAAQARLSLPLTAAVTQLVNETVARGDGDLDHSALYRLALAANGLEQ